MSSACCNQLEQILGRYLGPALPVKKLTSWSRQRVNEKKIYCMESHIEAGASADDWMELCFAAATSSSSSSHSSSSSSSSSSLKTQRRRADLKYTEEAIMSHASKPHSTPLTLKWLEENYEMADGVCIPRSTLYLHYLDYCHANDTQPVNAASFGKIIRQQFPQITTRRLGTRGQSKYHYYGIGIKESSIYFDLAYSKKGFFSGESKKEVLKQVYSYSPRSKLGTILPDFPSVQDIFFPPSISIEKISTFLVMYRTHCQRILDNVIRANFEEIQSFLVHFWRGMPQHIVPLMNCRVVVDLIGVCDGIMYKTVANVLIPSVLQPVSDSLIQSIRKFARHIEEWTALSLQDFPKMLQQMKLDLSRHFSQMLRRQASLNHLCQAVKSVMTSPLLIRQMAQDWSRVDLQNVVKQTLLGMERCSQRDHETILSLQREFEELLGEQVPMETYCQWLSSIVDRCVQKPVSKKPNSLSNVSRLFLLTWTSYGSRVIRDMTLQSAPTFGSFHLLHLMFDEYILFLVEHLQFESRSAQLLNNIKRHGVSESMNGGPIGVQERQSVITDGRELLYADQYANAALPAPSYSSQYARPPVIGHSIATNYSQSQESKRSCIQMTFDNNAFTYLPHGQETPYTRENVIVSLASDWYINANNRYTDLGLSIHSENQFATSIFNYVRPTTCDIGQCSVSDYGDFSSSNSSKKLSGTLEACHNSHNSHNNSHNNSYNIASSDIYKSCHEIVEAKVERKQTFDETESALASAFGYPQCANILNL